MTCTLVMKDGKIKKYKKVKDFSICPNSPELYMIHVAIEGGSKHKFVNISETERFMVEEENIKC